MLEIERVHSDADLAAIYRLRVEAWRSRTEDFPAMDQWRDAYEETAYHWAARDGGVIVAAARLTIHNQLADAPSSEIYQGILPHDLPGPIAEMTRLVVARSHAGTGLSRKLDETRIEFARSRNCTAIVGATFAGPLRIKAATALGFQVVGQSRYYADGPLRDVNISRGIGGVAFILNLD